LSGRIHSGSGLDATSQPQLNSRQGCCRPLAVDGTLMFDAKRAGCARPDPMAPDIDLQPAIATGGAASARSARCLIHRGGTIGVEEWLVKESVS
jgi:hypothetical protein